MRGIAAERFRALMFSLPFFFHADDYAMPPLPFHARYYAAFAAAIFAIAVIYAHKKR